LEDVELEPFETIKEEVVKRRKIIFGICRFKSGVFGFKEIE
jgi:hypothetical protein